VNVELFPEALLAPEEVPDERYTPRVYFGPLDAKYGFTVDVCATRESAKCPRFYTIASDGLRQPWECERVFCNPPYSDIRPWVLKAWSSLAELVLMVLPNNRQEQAWWQDLVEPWRDRDVVPKALGPMRLRTYYPPSRWRFGFPGNPEGVRVGSPNFGVVLLEWRRAL
jgi:hypothetical protein